MANLWSGGHHGYLSFMTLWWQLAGLKGGRALVTGEALVLPPGYRVVLLQAQHIAAQVTGKNIANEVLDAPHEWVPEGEVIHWHMMKDDERNILVALNVAVFEDILYMAHKLNLVISKCQWPRESQQN